MNKKIATLGPDGTYTVQAAREHSPEAELTFCRTIKDVVKLVREGEAEEGVIPLENSIEGIVAESLDEVAASGLLITKEVVLDIHHAICGISGDVPAQEVTEIYSHPQALSQSANYISRHYPQAAQISCTSTAAAVSTVSKLANPSALAIGSEFAARHYNLQVIEAGIEDEAGNQTRFVVFSKQSNSHPLPFSLIAVRPQVDRPGLLHDILSIIKEQGINMASIDSRPSRSKLGSYVFYIRLALNSDDSRFDRIVSEAGKIDVEIRKLNS